MRWWVQDVRHCSTCIAVVWHPGNTATCSTSSNTSMQEQTAPIALGHAAHASSLDANAGSRTSKTQSKGRTNVSRKRLWDASESAYRLRFFLPPMSPASMPSSSIISASSLPASALASLNSSSSSSEPAEPASKSSSSSSLSRPAVR